MTNTSQADFDQRVWSIISNIPVGQVMSYGEVAHLAGFPRHARMVSKAMARSPKVLPWFRVVRANRTLAFDNDSELYQKQARLLKKEGVKIIKGKVISCEFDKTKDLDELLWG